MNKQSQIPNPKSQIVIVGGGPAGASLAIRLAQADFRVVLVEREKFPRQKLCGEFISPECLVHFRELGVLDEMLSVGGDRIAETVFYEPGGRSVSVPSKWFGNNGQNALSISRAEMDLRLLERARRLGVEVLEENTVVDLLMENGAARGIKVRNKTGETAEICADLTIDATGRARVLAKMAERFGRRQGDKETRRQGEEEKRRRGDKETRRQGEEETRRQGDKETRRQGKNPKSQIPNPKSNKSQIPNPKSNKSQIPNRINQLVGFKAHLRNVHLEKGVCEIYFFPGGYGGLSYIEKGLANHCFLIDAETVKKFGGDAGKIVENVVFANKRARQTLKDAEPVFDWLAVSVDGFGQKDLTPAPNLLTVGDASAFIDPFTGSGMLMALESAEILAEIITENRFAPENTAEIYKLRHRRKFQKRLRVCSILRQMSSVPGLTRLTFSALSLSGKIRKLLARSTRKTLLINKSER